MAGHGVWVAGQNIQDDDCIEWPQIGMLADYRLVGKCVVHFTPALAGSGHRWWWVATEQHQAHIISSSRIIRTYAGQWWSKWWLKQ